MYREHAAYARFCDAWAAAVTSEEGEGEAARLRAEAVTHRARAAGIAAAMEKFLWSEQLGVYVGLNMSTRTAITARE